MRKVEDIIRKNSKSFCDATTEEINHKIEEDRIEQIKKTNSIPKDKKTNLIPIASKYILISIEPDDSEENLEELCNSIWNSNNLKEKLYILDKAGYSLSI